MPVNLNKWKKPAPAPATTAAKGAILIGPDGGRYRMVNGKKVYVGDQVGGGGGGAARAAALAGGPPKKPGAPPPPAKDPGNADFWAQTEKDVEAEKANPYKAMPPEQLKQAGDAADQKATDAGTAWAKNPNDPTLRENYAKAHDDLVKVCEAEGHPEDAEYNRKVAAGIRAGKSPEEMDAIDGPQAGEPTREQHYQAPAPKGPTAAMPTNKQAPAPARPATPYRR